MKSVQERGEWVKKPENLRTYLMNAPLVLLSDFELMKEASGISSGLICLDAAANAIADVAAESALIIP